MPANEPGNNTLLDNVSVTNLTAKPQFEFRTSYETVLASLFLILTMLTALIGNIAVIFIVSYHRNLRKEKANMLIVNLCVTDMCNSLLVMLSALAVLVTDTWPLGQVWCDCVCAINYCLIIVSMLTLCSISVDRYHAVLHPLAYEGKVSRTKLMFVIIYTWIQGITFGLVPSVLGWVDFDYWEAICAIQWHLHRPASLIYVISAFLLCFLGPGIVLIYCYVKILKEVKKQKNQIQVSTCTVKKGKYLRKKLSEKSRIVWSLLVVVLAYFICTTPFSVTKLIKVSVSKPNVVPNTVNLTAALLGYVASAINPLIYGIFRRDFRQAYKQIVIATCFRSFGDTMTRQQQSTASYTLDGNNSQDVRFSSNVMEQCNGAVKIEDNGEVKLEDNHVPKRHQNSELQHEGQNNDNQLANRMNYSTVFEIIQDKMTTDQPVFQ